MKADKTCLNPKCHQALSGRQKRKNKYCSSTCSGEHQISRRIQDWINGDWNGSRPSGELSSTIRNFLLEETGYKCSDCGWDKINPSINTCPLEVDHIDGISTNNDRNNLKVLCPNCHSLTPTYKSLNKTGRAWRKNYNQFELKGQVPAKPKPLCECGNTKSVKAKSCRSCLVIKRKDKNLYPPISEIIAKVEELGMSAYSKTLGISDTGLKKYLKRNGITEIPKKIAGYTGTTCHCGIVLSVEDAKTGRKRCPEHRPVEFIYPPIEEILAGIQELGISKYARKIGVPYASTLRKHLQKRGVL